ncbi:SAM-dependent chlorinase/fluorinase [Candidatus Woesearchaeota archaeon]|nr:SAM-dependent chlorinase/fluorinase [Candidatus Woesearchaeota archaeon]
MKQANRPFISLTSDFGVQSQGVGIMHGVALSMCPEATIIDLMHGLPSFTIIAGARAMETVFYLPKGCHVCVVDPGVGTKRRGLIIKVGRGDYLIGPDNGVLIPATRFLGGITQVRAITHEKYMRQPVSPIFHGRDVFTPAAAHLCNGVSLEEFGPEVPIKDLVHAPYEEAHVDQKTLCFDATIISTNKFGSCHLNIRSEKLDVLKPTLGHELVLLHNNKRIMLPYSRTFGDVPVGKPLIIKDDYGRVELAINQADFCRHYGTKLGDSVRLTKKE